MKSQDIKILGLKPKKQMKEQKYHVLEKNTIFIKARCSRDWEGLLSLLAEGLGSQAEFLDFLSGGAFCKPQRKQNKNKNSPTPHPPLLQAEKALAS